MYSKYQSSVKMRHSYASTYIQFAAKIFSMHKKTNSNSRVSETVAVLSCAVDNPHVFTKFAARLEEGDKLH